MSNKKYFLKFLKKLFSNNKLRLTIGSITTVIAALLSRYSEAYIKNILDNLVINNNRHELLMHSINLIFLYLGAVIFLFISILIFIYAGEHTTRLIKNEIYEKFQDFSIDFFDKSSHGDILDITVNNINEVSEYYVFSNFYFFENIFSIIIILVIMTTVSIPLTLLSLFFLITTLSLSAFISNFSVKYYDEFKKVNGEMTGYIQETLKCQNIIKVLNYEKENIERFRKINKDLFKKQFKSRFISNTIYPFTTIIGHIQYSLTALFALYLISKGYTITIGIVAMFLILTKNLANQVQSITYSFQSFSNIISSYKRYEQLNSNEKEIDEGKVYLEGNYWILEDGTKVERNGNIEFIDVNFGYNKDKLISKNINMYAKKGQKVALVGTTGAGKTTITNLITRFYEINSGKITIDGIDIRDIRKKDLRDSITIILQDICLFNGTIFENIKFNNDVDDKEVYEVSKSTNIDSFVKKLSDKYNTYISNENEVISQGQKQLISIARAKLRNSPVIILDEATSNIDTRTEKIVQEEMDKILKEKTSFVIAHRLSTIMNSDVIMVMENGEIIERGNHEQLLKLGKKYAQLYYGSFK